MTRGIERLDGRPEELEALVEKARVVLDEGGYQKLMAAVRTLGYVTTLLEDQRTSLEISTEPAMCATDGEDRGSLEESRHRHWKSTGAAQGEETRARPSRCESLSWGAEGSGSPCILKDWRPMPALCSWKSLSPT
jgi:hypothetical protein